MVTSAPHGGIAKLITNLVEKTSTAQLQGMSGPA
ncbi:hypothetical protein SLEP1_g21724 [Rubroshorea leprosula]|uniref:Uncharacterized protein n=1 Tax=Rubroshorea leprosula TaxID=152421 RepID=A0AAV5J6W9_9ROSI|nr:hypothetical protein SLEP1_g21724 [Rubroshorea leprosula]